jgi:hypothetical protein
VGQVVSRAGDDAGDLYATTRMLRIAEILMSLIAELLRWARLSVRSTQSIKAENLFLRRQLGLYIERGQASPDRLRDANCSDAAVTMLRLARRLGGGSPHDIDSLASSGMETVLADEVPFGPTADPSRATGVDSPNGE